MIFNNSRVWFFLFTFLVSFAVHAQPKVYENKAGKYKISVPQNWKERVDGSTTDIFVPDEGELDSWKEFVGVSLSESNGVTLDEAFNYYMKEDFPGYYKDFKVEKKGDEIINGQKMKWMVYSFTTSTVVNGVPQTSVLYDIFYLTLKNKTLYSLNAIAEKEFYTKLEADFLTVIRSFKINP